MMVKFADGRLVQYRSVSEIRQALALVDSGLTPHPDSVGPRPSAST